MVEDFLMVIIYNLSKENIFQANKMDWIFFLAYMEYISDDLTKFFPKKLGWKVKIKNGQHENIRIPHN